MRGLTAIATLALVGACKPAAPPHEPDEAITPAAPALLEAKVEGPAATTTAIGLDAEGLRFVDKASGKTSLLAFGIPRAQAEAALARVRGVADDRSTNVECGTGSMEFTRFGAMTLNFQDGNFVGWFLGDEPGSEEFTTMSGVGIGTTRGAAKQSADIVEVQDSALGEEFTIGSGDAAIGGMFVAPGEEAKIDALFAGANCFFR